MTISYVPLRVRVRLLPRQWDTVCESRSMVFGSTKFGRCTTLQCNYSQLRWETVSFSFIIVRDKFSRYYSEGPTPLQGFSDGITSISSLTARRVCKEDRTISGEQAMTKCLTADCCTSFLPWAASQELPSLKWLNGLKTLPPVKRALPVSTNVCKRKNFTSSRQWKKRHFTKQL